MDRSWISYFKNASHLKITQSVCTEKCPKGTPTSTLGRVIQRYHGSFTAQVKKTKTKNREAISISLHSHIIFSSWSWICHLKCRDDGGRSGFLQTCGTIFLSGSVNFPLSFLKPQCPRFI